MNKNVGSLDRWLRILVGIVLIAIGYYYSIWWLYIIAAISILTGFFRFCGLYKLLGINTNKKMRKK